MTIKKIFLFLLLLNDSNCFNLNLFSRRNIIKSTPTLCFLKDKVGLDSKYLNIYNNAKISNSEDDKQTHNLLYNKNNENHNIYLYGEINDNSCLQLSLTLEKINRDCINNYINKQINNTISLHIQSMGGSLLPAFYVCDLLKNLETPVNTYIDGYAASAASLISVCGNKRYITKHSSILLHQLRSSMQGKDNELREELDNLNQFMIYVKDIYLANTNFDENELNNLLLRDKWLNSTYCLKNGLVDEIL